jgi:hypothetical protein
VEQIRRSGLMVGAGISAREDTPVGPLARWARDLEAGKKRLLR